MNSFCSALLTLADPMLFTVSACVGSSDAWINPQHAICRRLFDMRSEISAAFFIASASVVLEVGAVRAAFEAQTLRLDISSVEVGLSALTRGAPVQVFAFHAAAPAASAAVGTRAGVVTAVTPEGRAFVALDDEDRTVELEATEARVLDGGVLAVGCTVSIPASDLASYRSGVCDSVVIGAATQEGTGCKFVFTTGRAAVMVPACNAGEPLSPSVDVAVTTAFVAAVREMYSRHCSRFVDQDRRAAHARVVLSSLRQVVSDAVCRLACASSTTEKFERDAGTAAAAIAAILDDAAAARACGGALAQDIRVLPKGTPPADVCAAVGALAWRSPWMRSALRHAFVFSSSNGLELLQAAMITWRGTSSDAMNDVASHVDGSVTSVGLVCAAVGTMLRGDADAAALCAAFAAEQCAATDVQYLRMLQAGGTASDGVMADGHAARRVLALAPSPNVRTNDVRGLIHGLVPTTALATANNGIAATAPTAQAAGSMSPGLLALATAQRVALHRASVQSCSEAVEAEASASDELVVGSHGGGIRGDVVPADAVPHIDAACNEVLRMSISGDACAASVRELELVCARLCDHARVSPDANVLHRALNALATSTVTLMSTPEDYGGRAVCAFFSALRELVKDCGDSSESALIGHVVHSACAVSCMLLSPVGIVPVVRSRDQCSVSAAAEMREGWAAMFGPDGEGVPELLALRAHIASCGELRSGGAVSRPMRWCCDLAAKSMGVVAPMHGAEYLRELPRVVAAVSAARDVTSRAGTRRGAVAYLVAMASAACGDDGAVARALCVDAGVCYCIALMVHDDDIATRVQVVAVIADVLTCATRAFNVMGDTDEESMWATLAAAFDTSSCVSGLLCILTRGRDGEGMVHAARALRALLAGGAGGSCGAAWNIFSALVDGASAEKLSKLKKSVARGVVTHCNEALQIIAAGEACASLCILAMSNPRMRSWCEATGTALLPRPELRSAAAQVNGVIGKSGEESDAVIVARLAAGAIRIDTAVRHMLVLASESRNRDLQECGSALWSVAAALHVQLAAGNARDGDGRRDLLACAVLMCRLVTAVSNCGLGALSAFLDCGARGDLEGSVVGDDGSGASEAEPKRSGMVGLDALLELASADVAIVPGVADVARLAPFVCLAAVAEVLQTAVHAPAMRVSGLCALPLCRSIA